MLGTRMSCFPFTEAHVTSGCSEPEVTDFQRKYWCLQTAPFPPRDRIFAEPHWTNVSLIVASYDLYRHDLKRLLLLRGHTSINQAGHEVQQSAQTILEKRGIWRVGINCSNVEEGRISDD